MREWEWNWGNGMNGHFGLSALDIDRGLNVRVLPIVIFAYLTLLSSRLFGVVCFGFLFEGLPVWVGVG